MTTQHTPSAPEDVTIEAAGEHHRDALNHLWTVFRHEMSVHTGELPDAGGRYRRGRLDSALAREPGWQAWIAMTSSHPVGFAVARALDEPVHVLTSFFVVAPVRRGGLGSRLATTVMRAHPGRWRIAYQDANVAAARFWSALAADLDPEWTCERLPVPGRHELPPDSWISLTTVP